MAGPQLAGCWVATIRWDATVRSWAQAELWGAIQEVFDQWPFTAGKTRCRCGKNLNVHSELSPEGKERWALWCRSCQFGVTLQSAPETVSGTVVVVVSVPPGTAKLVLDKANSSGL